MRRIRPSLKFTAGDLTIHRLIEEETTFLPVHDLFAGLTPDLLAENRQWLRDSGAIDATDTLNPVPVFTNTPDAHRDGELGDTIMSRRHETHTISIGIDHGAWCPDARSRNDQLAIAAGRCGRQRFDVMIELYHRAQRVVPVLFLAAANRQDMIEANRTATSAPDCSSKVRRR